jgi:spermidine synthase
MSTTIPEVSAENRKIPFAEGFWPFYVLFFISGFPALLYQIVWQRALFTIYGVNIESVTVIVTVFMLGLGLGSLAGGWLSSLAGNRAIRFFGMIELAIAILGTFSLPVFHAAAQFTAGKSTAITAGVTFVLLLVPTLLMGSTLPLLVSHLVKASGNVGGSVGALYAVNTFGSGVACWLAAIYLMRTLGESGVVHLAACLNLLVGSAALLCSFREIPLSESKISDANTALNVPTRRTAPMFAGICVAAASGFIALGYEIIWYRLYSFASGGAAPSFAKLLAFYLLGIAYGSLAVHDACRNKLKDDLDRTLRAASSVIAIGALIAFLIGPTIALLVSSGHIPLDLTYPLISIAAALLGAVFPLISHATIEPEKDSGRRVSYLYLSNIIGSTLGSFLIGFVVMNHLSTRAVTVLLLAMGVLMSIAVAFMVRPLKRGFLVACSCAAVLLMLLSNQFFARFYERLLLKTAYRSGFQFRNLVENRSGVIAVDDAERVFGGGAYDGQFNVDPVTGNNGIFRAYAIPAIHPHPRQVLVIGLASGSWTQVLAHHPELERMTIVEINPGYLQLIQSRPNVASLLTNPKVQIEIDDGRRWLVAHPDRKFDFILMNTTHNWRANSSNLLSVEFLQLLHQHLNAGGVAYYNTTSSGEVQRTGATAFSYALRISNFLAVSDSPIYFDRERCRRVLTTYAIDGRAVFDPSNPAYRTALEHVVTLPYNNSERVGQYIDESLETRSSLLARLRGELLITDDNMGTEWLGPGGPQ